MILNNKDKYILSLLFLNFYILYSLVLEVNLVTVCNQLIITFNYFSDTVVLF